MNTMIFLIRDSVNKPKRVEGIQRYTMKGIKWKLKNQPFKHAINPSLPPSFILMPKLGKNFMHCDEDFFAKEFCYERCWDCSSVGTRMDKVYLLIFKNLSSLEQRLKHKSNSSFSNSINLEIIMIFIGGKVWIKV